jgi:hypothetical protein
MFTTRLVGFSLGQGVVTVTTPSRFPGRTPYDIISRDLPMADLAYRNDWHVSLLVLICSSSLLVIARSLLPQFLPAFAPAIRIFRARRLGHLAHLLDPLCDCPALSIIAWYVPTSPRLP